MKLIPQKRYVWHVPLPPEEVMERIRAHVQPRYPLHFPFRFTDKPKLRPFEGEVQMDHFTISRVIGYSNSFMPLIEGQVAGTENGSVVRMDMKLAKAVKVFLYIWFGFLSLFALLSSIPLSRGEMVGILMLVFPVFMALFGIGLSYAGFTHEHDKAVKELNKIFGTSPITRTG